MTYLWACDNSMIGMLYNDFSKKNERRQVKEPEKKVKQYDMTIINKI